ncbi:two pore domain potassium channel family protein [Rhodobacteraceae bacterium F11138]|nr:two pore domain potassium channel family protein [Rhodobacteraceae bacterium F11138]
MGLMEQILWGSGFLGVCMLLHVAALALTLHVLGHVMRRTAGFRPAVQTAIVLSIALGILVLAITAQVWIWSMVWISKDILTDWNTAIYFSMVTFTTLGYGDVVLGPEARVFASFGAVTGLLSFGLSTAFLFAVTTQLLNAAQDNQSRGAKRRARGAP